MDIISSRNERSAEWLTSPPAETDFLKKYYDDFEAYAKSIDSEAEFETVPGFE